MYIIKLNAIDSTNSYLKELSIKKMPKDFTVVVANKQTKGRGQMGTHWQGEDSKNLTFSIFKDISNLNIAEQFYLSMAVSLGLLRALKRLQIPKVKIKWPNDILSENRKIAGILIENIIKQNSLVGSIIGIGLNVNQKFFDNLPNASSLTTITGIIYNKDEVLHHVLKHIETELKRLKPANFETIKAEYESKLFRIKKPSTFKIVNNQKKISGFIKGVTTEGKLVLKLEDDILKEYDLKDIQLLY